MAPVDAVALPIEVHVGGLWEPHIQLSLAEVHGPVFDNGAIRGQVGLSCGGAPVGILRAYSEPQKTPP